MIGIIPEVNIDKVIKDCDSKQINIHLAGFSVIRNYMLPLFSNKLFL
jgi:hypothetical protein